jgi:hypothetical protein
MPERPACQSPTSNGPRAWAGAGSTTAYAGTRKPAERSRLHAGDGALPTARVTERNSRHSYMCMNLARLHMEARERANA